MRRSLRTWFLSVLVLSLALSACGTQRLGHNSGADAGSSSQAFDDSSTSATTDAATTGAVDTAGGSPGTGGGSTPGKTSGGQGSTAPAAAGSQVARTASDRGVTKDEITLGVLAASESTFEQFGYTYKGKKHEEILKPFVDDVNERGGINGRKLVVKLTRYNPLSADDRSAACIEQSEDFKVFASIAPQGFWGDSEVCMAEKETPLLTGNPSSADTSYRRDKGWVRHTMMHKDRMVKNWVDWAVSSGMAGPKTRNGIIYTDVPEDHQIVNDVLIPYMKQRGLQVTEVAALSELGSAGTDANQAEAQGSVLKFKASGVELVWPATNFVQMLIWLQQAEAVQYRPRYTASDFGGMANTDMTRSFPASQWEGATGISLLRSSEVVPGQLPTSQAFKDCEAVYKAHGQTIGPDPNDASMRDSVEIMNMSFHCEHIALFAEAARRAGVNPTRRSYLAAFDGLGTWSHRVAMTERLSYARTKYDGPDYFAVVKWRSGCNSNGGCYRQIEGFRKGTW